jgi:hypothetical protein
MTVFQCGRHEAFQLQQDGLALIQRKKFPDRSALTQINVNAPRHRYSALMKRRLSMVTIGVAMAVQIGISSAAPQQLNCVLASGLPAAQNQPIVVVFDDNANTLRAQSGARTYSFTDVSISNVAISGSVGAISLGIDRSSLGMVWQQYAPEQATIEFGKCQEGTNSTADH